MTEQTIQVPQEGSNGIGTAGFILALVAVVFGWVPVLGQISWLLGLIFSAVGISKANKVNKGKGLSIAGLIISLAGLIIGIILISVGAMASAFM
ncbi:MAG: hypothetical protein N4A72_02670 [Bacteroidales bacterium]|jgi:hypothetical protein|nr:hypothetical protein [Bacteroidales bacterium]